MREKRCMSLLPRTTLRSDSEHIGLWEMGQLLLSMTLEWREDSTFALKATNPSKVFLHLKAPYVNYVHCIVLHNTVCIFLLCK
jgi:hypothetical protein